ncbi:hypothetical protein ACFPH6_20400 [Streptomyces xiangluensis]|uniref:Uncharacterized protein n=1 Tax=Streptomyces xiangluensis TaxID=2665720 RepID=A0ABV8YQW8_9ACTN
MNSQTYTAYLRKVTASMGWRGVGNPPPATWRTTVGAPLSRLPSGTVE